MSKEGDQSNSAREMKMRANSEGQVRPSRARARFVAAGGAAAAALLIAVPAARADSPGALTMGPQSMEGNLKVVPGTVLEAGYDFTVPGQHPAANISFDGAQVDFVVTCVTGSGGGDVVVGMSDATYADPANSSNWYPSGDQHSAAVYQGSVSMPDLCSGGVMSLSRGGTFSATVASDVAVSSVHVRWHYSANGTSGSWSGTASVTPTIGSGTTTTTVHE